MDQELYENYYWQDDRIRLRLWQPQDAEYSYLDELDSEATALVHEELKLPPTVRQDMNGKFIEANNNSLSFTIESLKGEYIGHIHFNYINERHGTFSIGIIIHKPHRGKGYAKAAMLILLEYAFNERRLHKFNAFCLDINKPSAALLKSIGCKEEGRIKENYYIHGSFRDQLLFGMTENEYRDYYNQ